MILKILTMIVSEKCVYQMKVPQNREKQKNEKAARSRLGTMRLAPSLAALGAHPTIQRLRSAVFAAFAVCCVGAPCRVGALRFGRFRFGS